MLGMVVVVIETDVIIFPIVVLDVVVIVVFVVGVVIVVSIPCGKAKQNLYSCR